MKQISLSDVKKKIYMGAIRKYKPIISNFNRVRSGLTNEPKKVLLQLDIKCYLYIVYKHMDIRTKVLKSTEKIILCKAPNEVHISCILQTNAQTNNDAL